MPAGICVGFTSSRLHAALARQALRPSRCDDDRRRPTALDTALDADGIAALYGRSLLTTHYWSSSELDALLGVASAFEAADRAGRSTALLPNELAYAMCFDNSTRTKSAWAGAACGARRHRCARPGRGGPRRGGRDDRAPRLNQAPQPPRGREHRLRREPAPYDFA